MVAQNKKKNWKKEIISTGLLILAVFSFRSSVVDHYVVPTGSMEPTVLPNDRIFVHKFAYDVKFPFTDFSLLHLADPKRGDVIVFKYPLDTSVNYVKRLVGLPGDEVEVLDGYIKINGVELPITRAEAEDVKVLATTGQVARVYSEKIDDKTHWVQRLPHLESTEIQHFRVPKDMFFFMGDNRDSSGDSRMWGFVPKAYLKGKALAVWFSKDPRQGLFQGFRWDRMGKLL